MIAQAILLDVAYRAGRASRRLGYRYKSNPYPEFCVSPTLREECAAKRAAWFRGWIEADADIAAEKRYDRLEAST